MVKMTCHNCRTECRKFGKTRKGQQRFRCCQCYKTCSEPRNEYLDGMYTAREKVEAVLTLLVEGCSIRSIRRITGVDQNTIMKILVMAGERCDRLLEGKCHGLPVRNVQCDEIWGFVGCKEKHNRTGNPEFGDAYCFVAFESDSKLVLTWHLGRRTGRDTQVFIEKLNEATTGKFQVTTDAFAAYFDAVRTSLGTRVDYAQLVKVYAAPTDEEHRYSPASVVAAIARPLWGQPLPERICTSHVERSKAALRTIFGRFVNFSRLMIAPRESQHDRLGRNGDKCGH